MCVYFFVMAQRATFAQVNDALSPESIASSVVAGRTFVTEPPFLPYTVWAPYTYDVLLDIDKYGEGNPINGSVHPGLSTKIEVTPEYSNDYSHPFYTRKGGRHGRYLNGAPGPYPGPNGPPQPGAGPRPQQIPAGQNQYVGNYSGGRRGYYAGHRYKVRISRPK
jgi:hypothetical protein